MLGKCWVNAFFGVGLNVGSNVGLFYEYCKYSYDYLKHQSRRKPAALLAFSARICARNKS